jgi:hypothetical protein
VSSRRSRRRRERERAKQARVVRPVPRVQRLLLIGTGAVMVLGGVTLLAAAGTGSAERLGRVAGILIVVGLVVLAVGVVGYR